MDLAARCTITNAIMEKNAKGIKVYYLVGYGRMASTLLSKNIAVEKSALNLGEMKYLFSGKKDDLLSHEWLRFKDRLPKRRRLIVRLCDSPIGFMCFPVFRAEYLDTHLEIFNSLGYLRYVDSSKTTLDVLFRPMNLKKCGFELHLIKSDVGLLSVIKSLWFKGKNSAIERHGRDKFRYVTFLISLCHLFVTESLVNLYRHKKISMASVYSHRDILDMPESNTYNEKIVYGNRKR